MALHILQVFDFSFGEEDLERRSFHQDTRRGSSQQDEMLPHFEAGGFNQTQSVRNLKQRYCKIQTEENLNSGRLSCFQKFCKSSNCVPLLLILDIMESGKGSYDYENEDSHLQFSLTTNTF